MSNADVLATYRRLVPERWRRHWTDARLDRLKLSPSLFLLYLGLRHRYPDLSHHTILMPGDYHGVLGDLFRRRTVPAQLGPDDTALYVHVPTRTDPTLAPPGGEVLYALAPVPYLDGGVDWAPRRHACGSAFCTPWSTAWDCTGCLRRSPSSTSGRLWTSVTCWDRSGARPSRCSRCCGSRRTSGRTTGRRTWPASTWPAREPTPARAFRACCWPAKSPPGWWCRIWPATGSWRPPGAPDRTATGAGRQGKRMSEGRDQEPRTPEGPDAATGYNTHAVERMTGVPATTFRAWERRYGVPAPRRLPGGRRVYREHDVAVVRWLREQTESGLSVSLAVAQLRQTPAAPDRPAPATFPLPELAAAIVAAAREFDSAAIDRALSHALAAHPLEMVCLDVVQPALVELGECWHRGEISPAVEHFATGLMRRRLEQLAGILDGGSGAPAGGAGSCAAGAARDRRL